MLSKTREELAIQVISTELKQYPCIDQLNQYAVFKYGDL